MLGWLARHWAAGVRLLIEIAAGAAAWFGGFELLSHFFKATDARTIAAQFYVVGTAIILLTIVVVREKTAGRKEKYANVTSYLHTINQLVKEISLYIHNHRPASKATYAEYVAFSEHCKQKFGLVLDQLNLVFASLTSTKCRTSIKLVYEIEKEAYYYTLARDAGCWSQCLETDNRRVDTNHDPLKKNSQFLKIFDANIDTYHYLSNDIPSDDTFRSTSFTIYDPTWENTGAKPKSILDRLRGEWPLPYRSTIACAIRLGASTHGVKEKPVVLGFVTVDSESRNVFEDRWDVQLMFAVAESLFIPLRLFIEIQNASPEP